MQTNINMTAVEWLADEIIMLEERLRQEEINLNDFMDLKDNLVTKALVMEKERLLEFGTKVAMKAHTGQSGWSIIEVYNENK